MSRIFSRHGSREGKRGFALIETLVYCAIVAFLFAVIVETTLILVRTYDRSRTYLEMNSAAITAFSRFSRDMRRATGVDEVASTLGASDGRIVLQMKRDDGTNDITKFYLEDELVRAEENGVHLGNLTPKKVAVTNLTFRMFSMASTSAVRVEMTVAPKGTSTVPALNFYGTYVLRGSYIE